MSISALRAVLENSRSKAGERCVLTVLAERADDTTWESWPSVETIAKEANVSERMARYALRDLEAAKEIQRCGGGGRRITATYRITLAERGQPIAPYLTEKGATHCPETATNDSAKGGNPFPKRGQPISEKGATHCPRIRRNQKGTGIDKSRATLAECLDFAREAGLPESDGESFFHLKEENGWRNGANKIRDAKLTFLNWHRNGWHPSQKLAANGRQGNPGANGQKRQPIDMSKPTGPF